MKSRFFALFACVVLISSACAARGGREAAEQDRAGGGGGVAAPTRGSNSTNAPSVEMFGTMEAPCGKTTKSGKTATVNPSEAGKGADKLYIGVASDRTASYPPELNKELWDASVAFVQWCNELGGIGGLPLEAVDLDAQVFNVPREIAVACKSVFALVGGGWALDDQVFSGKEGEDFHKCKLIALPGFAVSTKFSEANGVIQAIPNPAHKKSLTWLTDLAKLYPDAVSKVAVLYGDLSSIKNNALQNIASMEASKSFGPIVQITYDISSENDGPVVAQQVIDQGATAVNFVGEPSKFAKVKKSLADAGFTGPVFTDANQYDDGLFGSIKPSDADGTVVRIAFHPFEEADKFAATQKLVDILTKYNPKGKRASLSNQSFASLLLFSKSAMACADAGAITRKCIIQTAKQTSNWDSGGLHAAGNPGANEGPACSALVAAKDAKWERVWPVAGTPEDENGFSCSHKELTSITGDFGEGLLDPTRDL